MALGDIGMFLPGEAQYTKPGTYDQALRAEAAKTAMYLSSMDQFYANLEEAKSEFGQTLAFKEKALAQEKELSTRGLDIQEEQVALNREELAWRKQYQQGLLDYQNANLEAGVDLTKQRLDMLNEAQGTSGTQVPQLVPSGVYAGNPGTLYYGPSESVQSSAISYNTPETNFSVSDPWSDLDLFAEDLTAGY